MTSRILIVTSYLIAGLFALLSCDERSNAIEHDGDHPKAYLTTPDATKKFEATDGLFSEVQADVDVEIQIDTTQLFQSMDGFGYTLTGGSARLLWQMSATKRAEILNELFSRNENAIGVSYLRISIGASDLDEKVFSYNDLPEGTKDMKLEHFSLAEDKNDLIPILKEILDINPNIPIMASPWSAPTWMKTNGSSIGGSLRRECFDVYANYFVKYIHEMANEGIQIDAITIQNEPLHPGNNPSMLMSWEDQLIFIRDYLGPKFQESNIPTKIILYDHNADHIEYPINIMNDPEVKRFVDGSAFHLYGGEPQDIGKVHEAHPDKNLYFTEQWIGAPGNYDVDVKWHIENVFIGGSRNWCKAILEWNLAADPNLEPHTEGGCSRCLGALTINGDEVIRNPSYYIVAHASKFVVPGSKRIASNFSEALPNVAFLTPENKVVLLVVNNMDNNITFNVNQNQYGFSTWLPAGTVATFIWQN